MLVVHAAATWFMTGLIWFVQIVHYPLFDGVGSQGFIAYEERHRQLTTLVVGPLMLAELITGAWLIVRRPPDVPAAAAWAGFALIAAIWLSTALLQVPAHGELSSGFDGQAHARLVTTNWLRTIAWTARSIGTAWLLLRVSAR